MEVVRVPECPVCLEEFNNEERVPRVLSCGHSACQLCLPQLPSKFQDTIRCPSCNQLVYYPTTQGPSALPKNTTLLSAFHSTSANNNKITSNPRIVLQSPYGYHHLYVEWKDWILPQDSISIEDDNNNNKDPLWLKILQGKLRGSEEQIVSMLYIQASSNDTTTTAIIGITYTYTVQLMQFLDQALDHTTRDQLLFLLNATRDRAYTYGLWMNVEDHSLYLVCPTNNPLFLDKIKNRDSGESNLGIPSLAALGMEFCEALSNLHSHGLLCGSLSLSCFHLRKFGHVAVNLNEVLVSGRRIRKCVTDCTASVSDEIQKHVDDVLKHGVFVSPEILLKLFHKEEVANKRAAQQCSVDQFSDVWPLACILISLLLEESYVKDLFGNMYQHFQQICEDNCGEVFGLYSSWLERVKKELETLLSSEFESLKLILCRCLEFEPASRPNVTDVWKCMRQVLIKPQVDLLVGGDSSVPMDKIHHCLTISKLCDLTKESSIQTVNDLQETSVSLPKNEIIEKDILEGLTIGKYESTDLQAHRDCITSLAVGGGFLFSSSFDKTVHVWSLQDLSHVHTLRGHEHKVMGVVFVDAAESLCISADNGGGLFVWSVGVSLGQEPLKKWYEEQDWRYSGIHALAVSGTDHIYTGSGDKTIKAWSLRDYSLTCIMVGHKSVVSCLAVCDGVVYSGSWDGTIRLWSINDHSPLTVLGDDTIGNMSPSILSISVDTHTIAAAHENGCLKLWRNDVVSMSIDSEDGAIFALHVEQKWVFMGGWNKTLDVKEIISGDDELHIETVSVGSISCDSVITALLYCQGKLFAGFGDGLIKLYRYIL